MQVGHLVTNTGENRRFMLPTTKLKVEGTALTVLADTGASTSFFSDRLK